ncbi:MAG: DUF2214 family protein [Bdellovibrionales bacterium]|nr:DUF2214 family protein [Bdellovibrionales bacterium]
MDNPIWGQAALAYFHFLSILVLTSALIGEKLLYKRTMDRADVKRLQRLDIFYFVFAMTAAASGIGRIIYFGKGWDFYIQNPIFWAKMVTYILVAAVSIPPTIHFIQLGKQPGNTVNVPEADFRRISRMIQVEHILLGLMPLWAVLMARGMGR